MRLKMFGIPMELGPQKTLMFPQEYLSLCTVPSMSFICSSVHSGSILFLVKSQLVRTWSSKFKNVYSPFRKKIDSVISCTSVGLVDQNGRPRQITGKGRFQLGYIKGGVNVKCRGQL